MKTKHYLIALIVPVVIYLMGSFIAADIDFRHWEVPGRMLSALFMVIGYGGSIAIIKTENEDNE